jgi:hypothetical protein
VSKYPTIKYIQVSAGMELKPFLINLEWNWKPFLINWNGTENHFWLKLEKNLF